MALSKTRLEKLRAKHQRLQGQPDKLREQIDKLETELNEDEKLAVVDAVLKFKTPEPHPDEDIAREEEKEQDRRVSPTRVNADVNLAAFDYLAEGGFRGKQFKEYVELVEGEYEITPLGPVHIAHTGLDRRKMYTFEVYDVHPIIGQLYPGMKDSPTFLNGVKINTPRPIHTTKIALKDAILLNQQVTNAHAREHGGAAGAVKVGLARYYLLKKD